MVIRTGSTYKDKVDSRSEWQCDNAPINPQKFCIKLSPLKPTAKPEQLEFVTGLLAKPFTVELKVWINGKHRYALIDFETHEAAQRGLNIIKENLRLIRTGVVANQQHCALETNTHVYFPNGRPRPVYTTEPKRSRGIYVGNLRPDTTYEMLSHFATQLRCRGYQGVPMSHFWKSGENPLRSALCYGIITFSSPDEASLAFDVLTQLKMNNELDRRIFKGNSRIQFAINYQCSLINDAPLVY